MKSSESESIFRHLDWQLTIDQFEIKTTYDRYQKLLDLRNSPKSTGAKPDRNRNES